MIGRGRGERGTAPDLDGSPVSLPRRRRTPLSAVLIRTGVAVGLLLLTTVIVYFDRYSYLDSARPGRPLNLVGSFYYSAITLSATGYGDIVPVTTGARLVNTLVLTPIRVVFLVLLIGTTVEVLAERTRAVWRVSRWRSKMAGHTVVVGYGTKGRSAVTTLLETGLPATSIVVVDLRPQVVAEANRLGLAGVSGDATRRDVLTYAEIATAKRLVIAVDRDDTAVLVTLTARQLCPAVAVIAAVREAENEPLLRQSGADSVVVSSAAAGRLLGLATTEPGAARVMTDLLDRTQGLDLTERPASGPDIGRPARDVYPGVIAVLRQGFVFAIDDPRAGRIEEGDRLVVVSGTGRPRQR